MTRTKKIVLSLGLVVGLLGGAAVVAPKLMSDGVDYSKVESIEHTHEYQDASLLARAFALPVAASYQSALELQHNGSFCGPASLANVMHTLGIAGDQEAAIAGTGTRTIFGFLPLGLTLDHLADIARQKLGKKVTVLRDMNLMLFRVLLKRANDPRTRVIANFARGPLFGRGTGHFSPIAGYLADEDLVLVLDVNQQYRPWLVKADRLLAAMNTRDRATGMSRGLLVIE